MAVTKQQQAADAAARHNEIRQFARNNPRLSLREISKALGIPSGTVSRAIQSAGGRANLTGGPLSPGDQAQFDRYEARVKNLQRTIIEYRAELARAADFGEQLHEATLLASPPEPLPAQRSGTAKPEVSLGLQLSDWHIGEVCKPGQTAGWGQYNLAIAIQRLTRLCKHLTKYVSVLRTGYTVDEAHLLVLGDMVSGDIHEELSRSNEFPAPVQAVLSGWLLARVVHTLVPAFRRIHLHLISGSNHSRLLPKKQYKDGTLNSLDYVAYQQASTLLARTPGVTCRLYDSKKDLVPIAGYKFLCTHGDHLLSWMGLPWYAMQRDYDRECRRRMERTQDQLRRGEIPTESFDYAALAHFHVPMIGPDFRWAFNGALTGTTEMDHTLGRNAGPAQMSFLVSPKHGMFGPVPWRLFNERDERGLLKVSAETYLTGPLPGADPL